MKTVIVLLLIPLSVLAQRDHLLSPDEMKLDIAVMKNSLEEGYPWLYQYISKTSLDHLFNELLEECNKPHSIAWLYIKTSRLLTNIGEGHISSLLPSQISKSIYQDEKIHFPLLLRVIDGRLYIYRSYTDQTYCKPGEYISKLNGMSGQILIDSLLKLTTSDENNIGHKYKRIEYQQRELIPMVLGFPSTYHITVTDSAGESNTVTLPSISYSELSKLSDKRYPVEPGKPLNYLETDSSSTALLRLDNFSKSKKFNFEKFLNESFERIKEKHIKDIIIDLRDNHGGRDEYAALLLSKLTTDPFSYYTARAINHRRYKFLKYTDDRILNLMVKFFPKDQNPDGTYSIKIKWDKKFLKPNPDAFQGNVYFLVNHGTYSSGASFVHNAWLHKVGTFIGEPVAGSAKGGGAAAVSVTLPNSKIIVNVPIVHMKLPTAQHHTGTVTFSPEHLVRTTIYDLIRKDDPQMKYAKDLILKRHLH